MTEQDLIASVLAAATAPVEGDAGLTLAEIQEASGLSAGSTKRTVKALLKAGRMVAGRSRRVSMDGRMMPAPVYRFADGGEQAPI